MRVRDYYVHIKNTLIVVLRQVSVKLRAAHALDLGAGVRRKDQTGAGGIDGAARGIDSIGAGGLRDSGRKIRRDRNENYVAYEAGFRGPRRSRCAGAGPPPYHLTDYPEARGCEHRVYSRGGWIPTRHGGCNDGVRARL